MPNCIDVAIPRGGQIPVLSSPVAVHVFAKDTFHAGLWERSVIERGQLLDAFLSGAELLEVYYRWRPNLRDEGDNHVLELAVAAGDAPILTYNRRDFAGGQLRFPNIQVLAPAAWLKLG